MFLRQRKSDGATIMEYVIALSFLAAAFAIFSPAINTAIKNLNPETGTEVYQQAARNSFDSSSDDYFFRQSP